MKDQDKTKEQLIVEPEEMHRRIVKLEKSEIKHKQTEKKFREAEGKFLSIIDNVHDVIFQLSPLGIIKYVSPKVKELYGYEPEELIGKHLKTTTPISEVPRALDALKIVKSGKTIKNFEIKQLNSKGKIIYTEINATPVKNEGKIVAMQGIMRDITERKEAEEELKNYKKNLEKIIETRTDELKMTNERLWRDIIARKKAKNVETALYKISEATNLTRNIDDLFLSIHKIVAELMPAENFYIALYNSHNDIVSFPYFVDEIEESLPPRKHGKGLTEYVLRTGKPILAPFEKFKELEKKGEVELIGDPWVFWLGVPLKIKDKTIGVLTLQSYSEDVRYEERDKDILMFVSTQVAMAIDRKRAEENLQKSEEKLRGIFESIGNGIIITDLEANIIDVNNETLRMGGYSHKEELIGRNAISFVSPNDRAKAMENLSKELEIGNSIEDVEYVLLAADGSEFDVESNATVLYDNSRNPVGLINVIKDITARKKAEKIKASIYKIANTAHSTENLGEIYHIIHEIISELMPAKNNFYIALYDTDSEMLNFPYFIDEDEENPGPQKLGKGLTEYVLRTGEPLLASPKVFKELVKRGEVVSVGPPSIDWLGVPLKTKNKAIGVLVVQSYTEDIRYKEEDKSILTFISEQVAMAIDRKWAEEKIKASLEEKNAMLREIHHRVKNNMQIILSLLRLQSRHFKDENMIELFKVSQNRIKSMALIHESLYRSKDLASIDFSDYTKIMTTHLFAMHGVVIDVKNLKVDIEDVYLDINRAIPCGLIISELVSNSLKHAFPKGMNGEISVKMHSDKNGKHTLIIRDTGVGFPEGLDIHETGTLGMQLVTDLVKQLEGTIKLDREDGTTFKITF